MKLSKVQSDILSVLQLNADLELTTVARKLELTEKTVRYNVDWLFRNEIVERSNFLDIYPLGFRYIDFYFSVAATEKAPLDRLIEFFKGSSRVSWLAELGGDFHYGAAFAVRSLDEVRYELSKLAPDGHGAIFERDISTQIALTMFPFKLYGDPVIPAEPVSYGNSRGAIVLDDVGKELISLLAAEPGLSVRDMARRLGRSASSISARLEQLRVSGVHQRSWLKVNLEALDLSTYKLLLYTKGFSPELTAALKAYCARERCVNHLIECLGAWDFEVGLIVESLDQVMGITRTLYDQFGSSIRVIKNLPLLRVLKLSQVPVTGLELRKEVANGSVLRSAGGY